MSALGLEVVVQRPSGKRVLGKIVDVFETVGGLKVKVISGDLLMVVSSRDIECEEQEFEFVSKFE